MKNEQNDENPDRQKIRKFFYSKSWKEARIKIWSIRIKHYFRVRFEIFLKNDILRNLCIIIYKTDYAAYFQIFVKMNGYDIKIIINSDVTGNFILLRAVKKFKIYK